MDTEEMNPYAEEARQKWGHTDAYKQSQERVKKMSKDDFARISKEGDDLMKEMVAHMQEGPESDAAQRLIDRHYNALRAFYEPNLEIYRGLAEMYVADERFAAFYRKYHPDMAEFMRDAMLRYAARQTV